MRGDSDQHRTPAVAMDKPAPSQLNRSVHKLGKLRPALRWRMLTWAFGRNVPFMRTARLQFQDLSEEHAVLTLRNRRRGESRGRRTESPSLPPRTGKTDLPPSRTRNTAWGPRG